MTFTRKAAKGADKTRKLNDQADRFSTFGDSVAYISGGESMMHMLFFF